MAPKYVDEISDRFTEIIKKQFQTCGLKHLCNQHGYEVHVKGSRHCPSPSPLDRHGRALTRTEVRLSLLGFSICHTGSPIYKSGGR